MSDSVSTTSSDPTTPSTSDIDTEISDMDQAFQTAIQTNEEITSQKTVLGAEETAAQQRPNIG